MLANWVKQAVTAGGTGNLTLGSADSGFIDLNTAIGQGPRFRYALEDGANREVGIGYLSASTTFVRETVLETLVSGTLDRTTPAAINATTSAKLLIAGDAHGLMGAHPGAFFPNTAIEGMCSMGNVDETGTNASVTAGFLIQYPFWWAASKMVSQASVYCNAASAGATLRLGISSIAPNGKPGLLIKEFTEVAAIDCSTTGAKIAAPATPFWLPSGFYYITATSSSSTPTFKAPMYSPAGLFLGVSSTSGNRSIGMYREFTYGALPTSDESGVSYAANHAQKLSVWLK